MLLTRIPDPAARRGLQEIAGCDEDARALDIVFVHGLGGDAWTTWMADPGDIGTFWPYWVAADLPKLGLWTLGYAASGSKWQDESMPLADRGNQVLDLLSNEGLGERPLAFITHSMGGIVVKQILRHAESFGVLRWEAIAAQTKGIAFIATPHSGAHVATFAELAAAVYRTNEHVRELAAHDPRLRELHGWFLNYQRKRNVICRAYCEKREVRPEIPLLGVKLPKGILVVDETSAEPNIPGERAVPLDEDHISICKPGSRDAQVYKGVMRFLKDCSAEVVRPR
ncbi:alpha/beta fold hydrolase [Caballeronia sp. SEWSISQ10-4 2]|uniref:esterase/lipase family protein n=1 Tax=Caballeronia sp. SEWSISQ10-4 2 TaxID=2937438 RepID=UPI002656D721|nr:alpha/beta fold hydrolase [Caballeronia sp. SEWSISQ10-4 2]MDN7176988.1 alpha/beta fold hydrolase [Caballeronia sp. SEWSISQ10-4 2]